MDMGLELVQAGRKVPEDVNVIIEIPAHSDPIKYEVDKSTSVVSVDRFVSTHMYYPCDYGYIPQTLSEDGDPVDVLVVSPYPLFPGVVIRCRPVGMLRMTDESGPDAKILAVPVDKLTKKYSEIKAPQDLGKDFLASIEHFFQHYKDLETGKWVKTNGWEGFDAAKKEILDGIERYKTEGVKA
jgi:inorganic pyrophosphatase